MTLYLREDLAAWPAYRQGRAPVPRGRASHKLSSNENPYPPLPSVARRVAELIGSINRYPESSGSRLTAKICERFDVDATQVVLGSGSVEVISQLIRATAGSGDEIVFPWRSFEAYPLLSIAAGARPVAVPLAPGFRHDLAAMRAAVTPRTRLIVVCNPNNPTGTTVGASELEDFIRSVPPQITILIDEAYVQFNREPGQPSGIELSRRYSNVAVAHTFSKAYGLAGLRVGYAVAPVDAATAMRKVAVPFGVTDLGQAAAVASLEAEDELAERVDHLLSERERVAAELSGLGWDLPPTQTNFFWFPLGQRTDAAVDCFARHDVIVRPFAGEGLRVSLGEEDANDALVAAAAELAATPT